MPGGLVSVNENVEDDDPAHTVLNTLGGFVVPDEPPSNDCNSYNDGITWKQSQIQPTIQNGGSHSRNTSQIIGCGGESGPTLIMHPTIALSSTVTAERKYIIIDNLTRAL